ncbi:MAG: hypothetical protein J6L71_02605 [Clostridia bacterium]|nr:hypothetical protein [Clostridia bacterium]
MKKKKAAENVKKGKSNISVKDYMRTLPIRTRLRYIIIISTICIPTVLFLILSEFVFPPWDSAFSVLAGLGSFIMGFGVCNFVAFLFGESSLGHKFTIWTIAIGGIITLVTCAIMYVPDIYSLFDEDIVSLYLYAYFPWFWVLVEYVMFREAVNSFCKRKGLSGTRIEKLKKGMRNYWWYESIHKEINLGIVYHANKVLISVYPIALIFHVLFGWMRPFIVFIGISLIIITIFMAVLQVFTSIQNKREEYGVPFVLFRKKPGNHVDSSLFDIVGIGINILLIVIYIKMALDIFA